MIKYIKKTRINVMKKRILILFFLISVCVFNVSSQDTLPDTQETPAFETINNRNTAFSYGADVNVNSSEGLAYGAVLGFEFKIAGRFHTGILITASSNGTSNSVIEPSVLVRYYFSEQYGFFLQLDAGASIIAENDEVNFTFLGGLRSGYRFQIGAVFFIEPFLRMGYPFLAGGGVLFGYRY